jgi:CRISPR-associated protein Cas1
MEPMRPVVDRVVLGFAQAHTLSPGDVTLRDDGVCRINPQLARNIVGSVAKPIAASEPAQHVLSVIRKGRW